MRGSSGSKPGQNGENGRRERLRPFVGRLDRPMTVLGLLFLLVVVAEPLVTNRRLAWTLTVVGWLLWAAFVAEFILRVWVAPDRRQFLRRNWWQIIFLAVPFLRFARALRIFRIRPIGQAIQSVGRGVNPAARLLSKRLAWLMAVTILVVLSAGHVLYVTGAYPSFARALHDSALTTISGEPLGVDTTLSQGLDIALAAYSVIVFATVAGSIGAFFLGGKSSADTNGG